MRLAEFKTEFVEDCVVVKDMITPAGTISHSW